jgi:hypothetical protein
MHQDWFVIFTVNADYSQFYLRMEDEAFEPVDFFAPDAFAGLATVDNEGQVMFIAFRQYGAIPIDLEVLDAQPNDLSAEWQDIVELSIAPASEVRIEGWDGGDGVGIGNEPGRCYRVQFAVANADLAETTDTSSVEESYRIRLWPAEPRPPQIVRNESARAQYWTFQRDAARAFEAVAHLDAGTRTAAIIDVALREHPDTAQRIRSGAVAYRLGVLAYTQKIYPAEMEQPDIEKLIDEHAAALS